MKSHNMEMREISRYVQLLKLVAYEPTHNNNNRQFLFSEGKGLEYSLLLVVPIIIGLFVTDAKLYRDFIDGKNAEPLKEIFVDKEIGKSMFREMLSRNQTFEESHDKYVHVELEEIIESFYSALFIDDYSSGKYETILGNTSYDSETREIIHKVSTMLSQYTLVK